MTNDTRGGSREKFRLLFWLTIFLGLQFCTANAAEYYVSPSGKGKGSKKSPMSLKQANAKAKPGDTINLLPGAYSGEPIAPARSGKKKKPITYVATKKHAAVFGRVREMPGPFPDDNSDSPAVIFLLKRSYIVVNGIKVLNSSGRFLYAGEASHITIENGHFENAKYPGSWECFRFKKVGDGIILRNNTIIKGNDSVVITGGDHHLIEGNTFDSASHTCLVLKGVRYTVIRNNTFTNPIQKLMEVFSGWDKDFGGKPRKSTHLVIEDNFFGPAPSVKKNGTNSGSGSAGIQYAGNESIIRRNVFYKCGMGMDFTYYGGEGGEAQYCEKNRFYNNTVYDCGWAARYGSGPGVWVSSGKTNFGDQIIMNNILYRNHAHADAHFPKNVPAGVQFAYKNIADFRLLYNNLRGKKAGQQVIFNKQRKNGYALKQFQQEFTAIARNNISVEPKFVALKKRDFRLKKGSACIDAGGYLTTTTSAGKGTIIPVADALFFSDGHEVGVADTIRIGNVKSLITEIDYTQNTLTVQKRVTWKKGITVTLDYQGKAPDMGAFEYGSKSTKGR